MLCRNYHPISLQDLFNAQDGTEPLPSRAVLVTFDDAYRDFAEQAWPRLRQAGVPVTLFVPTGFVDATQRTFWWDELSHAIHTSPAAATDKLVGPWGDGRLHTPQHRLRTVGRLKRYLKSLPHADAMNVLRQIVERFPPRTQLKNEVLSWNELRRLSSEGVAIGLHTRNHPLLNRVAVTELQTEIAEAWSDLCRHVGSAAPAFAYPGGATIPAAKALLQRAGIRLAFTTRTGCNDVPAAEPFLLRRIHVGLATTSNVLRCRLAAGFASWRLT
jgi:peptidoglycan/xylan/chitin deacetylase (PgdA/CDA1 family)